MLEWIFVLIAAGLFFILVDQALLAGLFLIAAVLAAIASFFGKAGYVAERVGKSGTKGMWKGLQEAETGQPDKAILEEAVSNAGEITGMEMGAPHTHKFKATGSIGDTANRLIDSFKKVFK